MPAEADSRDIRDKVDRAMPTRPPRLFIECTSTQDSAMTTGIQRVVRNILRTIGETAGERGLVVVPVVFAGAGFAPGDLARVLAARGAAPAARTRGARARAMALRWLRTGVRGLRAAICVVLPWPAVRRFVHAPRGEFGMIWCLVQPLRLLRRGARRLLRGAGGEGGAAAVSLLDQPGGHEGDILLLLDSGWNHPMWPAIARFRARGGRVIGVIYDLIPITHADTVGPAFATQFGDWVRHLVRGCDGLVAISASVAAEVERFMREPGVTGSGRGGAAGRALPVRSFHLGADPLDLANDGAVARESFQAIFARPRHVFIVVGSIEPRKNHAFILAAFDRAWARGSDAALVIIGRVGWKSEALLAAMAAHPRLGEELHLLRDVGDVELEHAYRHASALVIASRAEGFGLPIVEAFQRGLPVICSDIPVFREIADGRATFVRLDDPGHLADAILAHCAAHDPCCRGMRDPRPWITWRDSSVQLLDAITACLEHVR